MNKQPLFQVFVETTEGKLLPVFPKAPKELAVRFVEVINREITTGNEKAWSNPHIAAVL